MANPALSLLPNTPDDPADLPTRHPPLFKGNSITQLGHFYFIVTAVEKHIDPICATMLYMRHIRCVLTSTVMDTIVVLITTPSREDAESIGRYLVESRLAACVNILPTMISIFRWEGKLCEASESLLIVKTRSEQFDLLSQEVRARHRDTVPEIIALPIVQGSRDYLDWIQQCTAAA
jgi:periplasmic divalent cation tolerance protein